jgi:DNA-binding NtrC family response regulator
MNPAKTTLLIVDDEESIHRALERTLRREPYELLHAYDAGEAEAILGQHPEVRAIVCDHYMPGTPGARLHDPRAAHEAGRSPSSSRPRPTSPWS